MPTLRRFSSPCVDSSKRPIIEKIKLHLLRASLRSVNFSNVDQTAGYLQFHAGCRNKLVPFRTERWTLITLKGLFSVNSKYYNLSKCTEFKSSKTLENGGGSKFMRGGDGLDTEFHSTH